MPRDVLVIRPGVGMSGNEVPSSRLKDILPIRGPKGDVEFESRNAKVRVDMALVKRGCRRDRLHVRADRRESDIEKILKCKLDINTDELTLLVMRPNTWMGMGHSK